MGRLRKKIIKLALIPAVDDAMEYQRSLPPLGIGYLLSYIRRHCWFVEPIFCRKVEEVVEEKPDIVGISASSENFDDAIKIARTVKEALGAVTLIGGPHISGLPGYLPEVFDVGVIGEGEETLAELLKLYYTNEWIPARLQSVKGICLRVNGKVNITPPRPLISDLNTLPYPARDELRLESWAVLPSEQVHMITSRGCPYKCTFCASSKLWRRYRDFSSEYVVAEIEAIRERYDPEEIYFFDDLFIASRPRFSEIAKKIKERQLHKGIYFRSYGRVDMITEELADTFAELNFKYIDFGFESNSQKILDYFNKKNATPELNQRAVDILRKRDISIGANFILGAPVETTEDIEATYQFIKSNAENLDRLSFGPLFPIPGTPFWEYAKRRGIVSEDDSMDWKRLRFDPDKFDINYFTYLGENVDKQEFCEWIEKFTRLAKEIVLKGYIRRLQRRLADKETKLQELRKAMAQLQGSRIIRMANALREIVGKIFRKGERD